jgi:transposase-like protein
VRLTLDEKVDLFIGSHDSATREANIATIKGKTPYIYSPVYEGGEMLAERLLPRRDAAAAGPAADRVPSERRRAQRRFT